jgi:hypothetical protein
VLRRGFLVVVLGVVAVGVVTWVQRDQRDDEWAHGGDDVTVRAEIGTASTRTFPDVLVALGGPAGDVSPRTPQSVVAHVTWTGSSSDPGTYAFLLLDDRLAPPRPLRGYGGWWPGDPDGTGPHWDGRYEALSEHYPWLARAASTRTGSGSTNDTDALGVPAAQREATLAWYFDRSELRTARPVRDLVLAMVSVDADGEVRWARKVPLSGG